eukprot:SAG11_NODE_8496_length_1009_cov_0.867033_1_plen_38_part_10
MRAATPIVWHEFTRDELAKDTRPELRASAKALPSDVKT